MEDFNQIVVWLETWKKQEQNPNSRLVEPIKLFKLHTYIHSIIATALCDPIEIGDNRISIGGSRL